MLRPVVLLLAVALEQLLLLLAAADVKRLHTLLLGLLGSANFTRVDDLNNSRIFFLVETFWQRS